MKQELALNDYMLYLKEIKNASDNTVVSYRRDLSKFLMYMKKQQVTSFERWTETLLNSYILYLERSGLSPSTVSRNISSIKAFILYLIKHGIMKQDPTERIKSPKKNRRKPDILTVEEMDKLLEQPDVSEAKGIRDLAMLELIYATGIRVTELITLKVENVNLSASYLICVNRKKERVIPFGKKAQAALKQYMEASRAQLVKSKEERHLFTNCRGNPLSRQGFWKLIKSYGEKANIEIDLTPDTFRHSFAAHLMENGADLNTIHEILGYTEVSLPSVYFIEKGNKTRDVYYETHPRA